MVVRELEATTTQERKEKRDKDREKVKLRNMDTTRQSVCAMSVAIWRNMISDWILINVDKCQSTIFHRPMAINLKIIL